MLLVSQDYADIRRALHSSAVTRMTAKVIHLCDADNEGDIQTYTRVWVDRIARKFSPFTDDMKEYLQNLTVANAKGLFRLLLSENQAFSNTCLGMFLYARLVLQNLHVQPTREEVLDAIKKDNFPDGLQEA